MLFSCAVSGLPRQGHRFYHEGMRADDQRTIWPSSLPRTTWPRLLHDERILLVVADRFILTGFVHIYFYCQNKSVISRSITLLVNPGSFSLVYHCRCVDTIVSNDAVRRRREASCQIDLPVNLTPYGFRKLTAPNVVTTTLEAP